VCYQDRVQDNRPIPSHQLSISLLGSVRDTDSDIAFAEYEPLHDIQLGIPAFSNTYCAETVQNSWLWGWKKKLAHLGLMYEHLEYASYIFSKLLPAATATTRPRFMPNTVIRSKNTCKIKRIIHISIPKPPVPAFCSSQEGNPATTIHSRQYGTL